MSFLESNKKIFLILFSIYFLVNIPMLLNFNGIYWDDWILIENDLNALIDIFKQAAGYRGYLTGSIHYFLINFFGVYSYRILTFIFIFLSAWFIYKILNTINIFDRKDSFFISLLFLMAPLYDSKILLINFPYTLFNTIFYFSFYLLTIYIKKPKILFKLFILILFFISFSLNSTLIFYLIILIYIFYTNYNMKRSLLKNGINYLKKYLDFVLLPIIYYIIKKLFFLPTGIFEGYNEMNLKLLFDVNILKQIYLLNFFEPIKKGFYDKNILIIFILIIFILYFFRNKFNNNDFKKDLMLILFGGVIFFLGALPYVVVGKMPNLIHQDSRFQILIIFGFSFMLYYIVKIIGYNIYRNNLYLVLLGYFIILFSITNFKQQIKYNWEWIYQDSLIESLKYSSDIKNSDTFIVIDNTINNEFIRLGTTQMNGISKMSLGKDNKLFIYRNINDLNEYKNLCLHKVFNCYNWRDIELTPKYLSMARNKDVDVFNDIFYLMKLKYFEIFKNDKYKREIRDFIILLFEKK